MNLNKFIIYGIVLLLSIILFYDVRYDIRNKNRMRNYFFKNEGWFKNRTWFELISLGRIWVRCILILILAIFIFRDNSYIASKVILIVLIYFTIKKYFVVYAIQLEKSEIKKLKRKASIQQNIYLYSWLGEGNLKNSFLFEVLREDKMEKSDILNLNKVKWYLKKRLGDNVGDYHLLKSFLEAQQKNNLAELAKSFIAPLVVGCFSIILRELVSSEKFKTFINDFFNITLNNNDTFSYISLMLDIFLIVMLVIYSVIFVLTVLNKDKKRIGTIIAVLDNIIYEKEKK